MITEETPKEPQADETPQPTILSSDKIRDVLGNQLLQIIQLQQQLDEANKQLAHYRLRDRAMKSAQVPPKLPTP